MMEGVVGFGNRLIVITIWDRSTALAGAETELCQAHGANVVRAQDGTDVRYSP
jgi:hypothetical protein